MSLTVLLVFGEDLEEKNYPFQSAERQRRNRIPSNCRMWLTILLFELKVAI